MRAVAETVEQLMQRVTSLFYFTQVYVSEHCSLRLKTQRSVQHANHTADGDQRGLRRGHVQFVRRQHVAFDR